MKVASLVVEKNPAKKALEGKPSATREVQSLY